MLFLYVSYNLGKCSQNKNVYITNWNIHSIFFLFIVFDFILLKEIKTKKITDFL